MKHKNINTLAPLNKPLVGTVEEIADDTITISMAFIDKDSLEYKLFLEETSKNKVLVSNINTIDPKGHNKIENLQNGNKNLLGYSVAQLIHTSSITCHFMDTSGDAYIDIFSCKELFVLIILL
jgi:S-adenosylmethionine/arginine decarboxylase-like enzyme